MNQNILCGGKTTPDHDFLSRPHQLSSADDGDCQTQVTPVGVGAETLLLSLDRHKQDVKAEEAAAAES